MSPDTLYLLVYCRKGEEATRTMIASYGEEVHAYLAMAGNRIYDHENLSVERWDRNHGYSEDSGSAL